MGGISSYFLKFTLPFIEHSLFLMSNKSLGTASFPDSWKTERVMPISKMVKGREIELSSHLHTSRRFEALRKDSFQSDVPLSNSNSLLYKSQSGFRELFSTTSCLLGNVDDWCKEIDTGHYIGSVFIDLKKTFDTVDQSILCEKLIHYGIQHREIKWFRFYLSNRRKFCRVGGVDSEVNYVKLGVPQRSCLGPLLSLSISMTNHVVSKTQIYQCILTILASPTSPNS